MYYYDLCFIGLYLVFFYPAHISMCSILTDGGAEHRKGSGQGTKGRKKLTNGYGQHLGEKASYRQRDIFYDAENGTGTGLGFLPMAWV